ncbi:MAG: hypothetical protein WBG46_09515 [Nonlabens sp.]
MFNPKLKRHFSIKEIGKFRFYWGIIVGLGFSVLLNFILRKTLKFNNMGIVLDENNVFNVLNYEISPYYYALFAFLSVSLSFCFTTFIWMSAPYASMRNKTRRLRMAHFNSVWIFYACSAFLLRMFMIFIGMFSLMDELNYKLEEDYAVAGFLLPAYFYFYCWNLISHVYVSWRMFAFTTLSVFAFGGLLCLI